MPKKILFLSSGNLTTNPRLLKELRYAAELGWEVDFVGFDLDNWSQAIDNETIREIDAGFTFIPISRKCKRNWIASKIMQELARMLYFVFKKNITINAYAHSGRSFLLHKELQKNRENYDLIAAHVLPALFPAFLYSRKTKTPFVFDVEDYHPGETCGKKEKKRRAFLMKNILPKAKHITCASPLIKSEVLNLCELKTSDCTLINNCFAQDEFLFRENNSEKIKFVWFSQNISAGRGLEIFIPMLYKHKDKIELHLIGNLYQEFYTDFLSKYSEIITVHKPLPQKELNLKLSDFDIGLAIELNTADYNRQICLTNKIWAYFQSGLYILATDTPAQKKFLQEYEDAGVVVKQDSSVILKSIENILNDISKIKKEKRVRFDYAQSFSLDKELRKMNSVWNERTNSN